ncbi:MAG: iron-siderophore ABC transporter substrate-binding protein [Cyanobacteria bacterium P01_D01_bin.105]
MNTRTASILFSPFRCYFNLVASIFLLLSISACIKTENTSAQTQSTTTSVSTEDCQTIEHAMGETCVPLNPQRIVVLDYVMLDHTVAIGQKPVGSPLKYARADLKAGIVDLGDSSAINLERVLELQPDLILGITSSPPPYSQLTQIAPTVIMDYGHSGDWKEHFTFVGEVLGQPDEVMQVMADYYQRAAEFEQKMKAQNDYLASENRDEIREISIVRLSPARIRIFTRTGLIGTVLEDVGLSRPPSQDLGSEVTEALGSRSNPIHYSISKESLDTADGDVIFVLVDDWNSQVKDSLSSLKNDPLWLALNAVEQSKVYEVSSADWASSGPVTANAVLDDLFKYLLGK